MFPVNLLFFFLPHHTTSGSVKSVISHRKVHYIDFKIPGFGSVGFLWLTFWQQVGVVISQMSLS